MLRSVDSASKGEQGVCGGAKEAAALLGIHRVVDKENEIAEQVQQVLEQACPGFRLGLALGKGSFASVHKIMYRGESGELIQRALKVMNFTQAQRFPMINTLSKSFLGGEWLGCVTQHPSILSTDQVLAYVPGAEKVIMVTADELRRLSEAERQSLDNRSYIVIATVSKYVEGSENCQDVLDEYVEKYIGTPPPFSNFLLKIAQKFQEKEKNQETKNILSAFYKEFLSWKKRGFPETDATLTLFSRAFLEKWEDRMGEASSKVFFHLAQEIQKRKTFYDKAYVPFAFEPLSSRAVRHYARQLLEAIHAMHKEGVTHRDIKFENLLFIPPEGMKGREAFKEGRGSLKVLDFGFSTKEAELRDSRGSPLYMAPECLLGKTCTNKVDVFAIGVVLAILATGLCPDIQYYGELHPHATQNDALSQLREDARKSKNMILDHITPFPLDPLLADFLEKLGRTDVDSRLTVAEALKHPFLTAPQEEAQDRYPEEIPAAAARSLDIHFLRQNLSFLEGARSSSYSDALPPGATDRDTPSPPNRDEISDAPRSLIADRPSAPAAEES